MEQQLRPAIIEAARAGGVDIAAWADAKILEMIGGAAAEAKARRANFINDVLDTPACADDRAAIVEIARLAGLSDKECREAIGRGTVRLKTLWSHERKWAALLELAKALPRTGRLDGRKCWEIYSQALNIGVSPQG